MIHHQAAILNNFDPCFCKCFRRGIVANSGLQPHCLGFLRQDVFNVRKNFLRSAKHIDEIDIDRNISQTTIDLLPEYLRHFRAYGSHGTGQRADP